MTGPPTILVDVSSATHGRPWEIEPHHIQPINRTHSTLVKFSCHDDDYERVLGTLRRLTSAAVKAIPRRATRLVPEVMGTDQLAPSLSIRSLEIRQGQTAARFWLPYVQTVGPMSGQSKLRLLSSGETISCISTLFQLSMRRVTPQIDSLVILIQSSMPGLTLY
jgi:hypothetical protein